jgi:hypothetical protein
MRVVFTEMSQISEMFARPSNISYGPRTVLSLGQLLMGDTISLD